MRSALFAFFPAAVRIVSSKASVRSRPLVVGALLPITGGESKAANSADSRLASDSVEKCNQTGRSGASPVLGV
jgi:hypothetical protein